MIIDLHTHTQRYLPCSILTPADLIRGAEERGLDAIAITEHDHLWSEDEIEKLKIETNTEVLILRGQEVSSEYGHLLVFGYHGSLEGYSLGEILSKVHESGGVVIPSHPFRYGNTDRSLKDLADEFSQFDAIEALNGNQDAFQNHLGLKVVEEHGITGIGGSDAHSLMMIGRFVTEFYTPIGDEYDLAREIKAGRCRPIYNGYT